MKTLADEETLALIQKIFIDMPSANFVELTKNIVALDNAQYGELMKVMYLTKKDNQSRINFIKTQTKQKAERKAGTMAPK